MMVHGTSGYDQIVSEARFDSCATAHWRLTATGVYLVLEARRDKNATIHGA